MLKRKNSYIATNRRASYDYKIGDKFEAGIVLKGSEVKSLRNSRIDISHAFISQENGEIFLKNSNIPQYLSSGILNHEVTRSRKLLLKKKEIKRILGSLNKKGASLVPLKIYFSSKGFAKLLIAVGEGKKKYDKRQVKKEKEWKRQKKLI
ncbi:MAG: SsrA-binding protein [Alphaproteobacteria bacterium MarineAlpha6_Bin6]|nr:SsrA-binding protein [Pelagibacteraceae bacterium]PPR31809.1 MAG: SsrA-binding protein [Alphaproteobacteria bacterium MarineAlpha6_Bin6]PPR33239.1 MAG: SsrA-binding protein [Alphaproteobacteria bacterium MarineAlpha6_Bin5]|tara:strand:+ start:214 stop:663 length:450 start_codon:yes stop_codon:yes gene_type:complete